jgi:hypothetical protein
MSEKNVGAEIGEAIKRVREFGEKKDLPEETIKDFIKSDIEEIREDHEDDKKSSTEDWLEMVGMGSDDQIAPLGETLSNEGFMDAAGDVLRNVMRGKKPQLSDMNMPSKMEEIKRTYGNLSWVKSRRLIPGDVMVKGGNLLQGDSAATVAKLIQAMKVCSDKNKPIINKLLAQVKPYLDLFTSSSWKDPEMVRVVRAKNNAAVPDGADFVDMVWALEPADARLPHLDAEGVVKAAGLIQQLTTVYYGSPMNPFKDTSWYTDMYTQGSADRAWTEKDPRVVAMIKFHVKDQDTVDEIGRMADDLSTFSYGIEYDWSANTSNGGYEIGLMLRGLIHLIDASVK